MSKFRKVSVIIGAAMMLFGTTACVYRVGGISKVGKNKYAVRMVGSFKQYLTLCEIEGNDLICERGEGSMTGFGPVVEK